MGQYYFPVFLGDRPSTQKDIDDSVAQLEHKYGVVAGMTVMEADKKQAALDRLGDKIRQIKAMKPGKEFIRGWLEPRRGGNGSKLTEHASVFAAVVQAAIFYLSREGPFYKTRFVWAGDYADKEPVHEDDEAAEPPKNLHHLAYAEPEKSLPMKKTRGDAYHFFVNHTKRQFVDLRKFGRYAYHPIPLLTAEGNGQGGGDYRGRDEEHVGIWARDVVSVEEIRPPGTFDELEGIAFEDDS